MNTASTSALEIGRVAQPSGLLAVRDLIRDFWALTKPEVLLYRPMFRMRTGGDPAESSILFSFEIDFAGG